MSIYVRWTCHHYGLMGWQPVMGARSRAIGWGGWVLPRAVTRCPGRGCRLPEHGNGDEDVKSVFV